MHGHPEDYVDLFWLPLGAGGHCVRTNGRVYERFTAWRHHRVPHDLYHSALVVERNGATYAVEMAPVWNLRAPDRGAVCVGPVGARWLGRFRAFQYEVRRWHGGYIPDLDSAVASPIRLTEDAYAAAKLLETLPEVPPLVWGRDELNVGDMWNSNSLISWVLARSGFDTSELHPPIGGRAPGWDAGLALAAKQGREAISATAVLTAARS